MNFSRLILTASIAVPLCGCGTFCNAVAMAYPPTEDDPPNYVYGGVKVDAKMVQSRFGEDDLTLPNGLLALFFLADMPLSAVFDTLWLPATILETQRMSDRWPEWKERRLKYATTNEDQQSVKTAAATADAAPESN